MPLCAWLPGLSSAALPRAIDRALASVARIASARNDSGENGRDLNQPDMAQCRAPRVRVSIVFESGARIGPGKANLFAGSDARCEVLASVARPERPQSTDVQSRRASGRSIERLALATVRPDERWEADAAGSAARFGSAAANDRGATTVRREEHDRQRLQLTVQRFHNCLWRSGHRHAAQLNCTSTTRRCVRQRSTRRSIRRPLTRKALCPGGDLGLARLLTQIRNLSRIMPVLLRMLATALFDEGLR
jgi:hypothetical protein